VGKIKVERRFFEPSEGESERIAAGTTNERVTASQAQTPRCHVIVCQSHVVRHLPNCDL
jgi:hypothetical protein